MVVWTQFENHAIIFQPILDLQQTVSLWYVHLLWR